VHVLKEVYGNDGWGSFGLFSLADLDTSEFGALKAKEKSALREYRSIINMPTLPTPPELEIPKCFQLQDELVLDSHDYIGLSEVVDKTMSFVSKHCPKETTLQDRVPPVMVASLARSGKTTTLMAIFNHLHQHPDYNPIFLNFNGQSGFRRNSKKETDVEAFLRAVVHQLFPTQKGRVCSLRTLKEYLKLSTKRIVLLADELNNLASPPSSDLANLLRETFLDPQNRYFIFTSHWPINLDIKVSIRSSPVSFDLSPALGKRNNVDESPRQVCVVSVPVTDNYDELLKLANGTLSKIEVVLFCGLPGLVYSIKVENFDPFDRFRDVCKAGSVNVSLFADALFRQFETGEPDSKVDFFDRFTFREEKKVVWPLCYFRAVVRALKDDPLSALISFFQSASATSDEETGTEWEYVVRVAVGVVVRRAGSRDLSTAEETVVGSVMAHRPTGYIVRLGQAITTLASAEEYLKKFLQSLETDPHAHAVLIFAYPSFADFPDFDGLVVFATLKEGKFVIESRKGLQMKRGKYPNKDAPMPWSGVLIQGKGAKKKSRGSMNFNNWVYMSLPDVTSFFPLSLRRFIPTQSPTPLTAPSSSSSSSSTSLSFASCTNNEEDSQLTLSFSPPLSPLPPSLPSSQQTPNITQPKFEEK